MIWEFHVIFRLKRQEFHGKNKTKNAWIFMLDIEKLERLKLPQQEYISAYVLGSFAIQTFVCTLALGPISHHQHHD